MIRPGTKVKAPAPTSAPKKSATIMRPCRATSCRRARLTASGRVSKVKIASAEREGRHRRDGVNLDGWGSGQQGRERHELYRHILTA
jgi:hypothetical protein